MPQDDFPEGLGDPHLQEPPPLVRHASPLSLLILGTILALAAGGFVGGVGQSHLVTTGEDSRLEVETPEVLRNGEFFEMVVRATPGRPVADLVIAVEPSLWKQLTQNSMIPAAAEESFSDGAFRFSYGEAAAGESVEVKMDFQINPSLFGGVSGAVSLLDGEAPLVSLPVSIEVRP